MMSRAMVLKVSHWRFVERLVKRSFLFRPLVKRFIAGDSLDTALKITEELVSRGFNASLDYLGENTSSPQEANDARDAYVRMLDRIAGSPCLPRTNISIKLTQCGLDIGEDVALSNLLQVLASAQKSGNFVRVDMEASQYTEATLRIVHQAFATHQNVGTVLQTYLYRTPQDVERCLQAGMRLRLVKGAYLEPAAVAYPKKRDVDEAYLKLAAKLLDSGIYHGIATHDPKMIEAAKAHVVQNGIARDRFEFQMIYGVRRDLQERLLAEGYNVRIYVPFGDQWYPYFTRRLAERPANMLFILRSLFKG